MRNQWDETQFSYVNDFMSIFQSMILSLKFNELGKYLLKSERLIFLLLVVLSNII